MTTNLFLLLLTNSTANRCIMYRYYYHQYENMYDSRIYCTVFG